MDLINRNAESFCDFVAKGVATETQKHRKDNIIFSFFIFRNTSILISLRQKQRS